MITKEELDRVNKINKELYTIDKILKLDSNYVLSTITTDTILSDIKDFIIISNELNEIICKAIKEAISKTKEELFREYNLIISPSEPNSLSQS